jgi:ATP-dependent RNA helicase DHX37/DHR1
LQLLEYLGALDKEHKITPLGQSMSSFPILPRYAKMIILGQQFDNMPYLIAIVAALSVGDPFLALSEIEGSSIADDNTASDRIIAEEIRQQRKAFHESREQFSGLDPGCDVLKLLCAVGAYEYAGATDTFCQEKFLRVKTMREIRKLRMQITGIVNNQLSGIVTPVEFNSQLPPPSPVQVRTIKQVVAAAYIDHIAIRSDLLDPNVTNLKAKKPLRTPYSTLAHQLSIPERSQIFIHPNSALATLTSAPSYVVYSDIRESRTGVLRLVPLTPILATMIEPLAKNTSLIQYSKPLNYPLPRVFTQDGVLQKEVYVHPRYGLNERSWVLPQIKKIEPLYKTK